MLLGAAYVHPYLTVLLRRHIAPITFLGPSRQSRTKNALGPDVYDDFRSKIVSFEAKILIENNSGRPEMQVTLRFLCRL